MEFAYFHKVKAMLYIENYSILSNTFLHTRDSDVLCGAVELEHKLPADILSLSAIGVSQEIISG
jgi:hypothetical protein